jgi:Superinfection immunity protein
MRADINFLAGIIKQGCPTAPYLSNMRRGTSGASDGEKTMESFVDGICNLIGFYLVLGSMLGIYIAPLVIAVARDHHNLPWIGLLNLTAGWTVAGWIAALVWSMTAIRQPVAIMGIASTVPRTAQPAAA